MTLLKKEDVKKPWNICVLFPHLKDSYWVAANYGIAEEIRRTGTAMTLYEAGGYTNLSTQLSQMDNCIAQKFDGIILGAISADGVGPLVKKGDGRWHSGHRLRQRRQRAERVRPCAGVFL